MTGVFDCKLFFRIYVLCGFIYIYISLLSSLYIFHFDYCILKCRCIYFLIICLSFLVFGICCMHLSGLSSLMIPLESLLKILLTLYDLNLTLLLLCIYYFILIYVCNLFILYVYRGIWLCFYRCIKSLLIIGHPPRQNCTTAIGHLPIRRRSLRWV
jgi:hypothetical protein